MRKNDSNSSNSNSSNSSSNSNSRSNSNRSSNSSNSNSNNNTDASFPVERTTKLPAPWKSKQSSVPAKERRTSEPVNWGLEVGC